MKKVLVDINHPAHVHLFKYFINDIKKQHFTVIVAAKNVKSITYLLDIYEIKYIKTGKKPDSVFLKYIYEFLHILKLGFLVYTKGIDYGIGVSMVLPLVSKFSKMKSICLDDDDLKITPIFGKFVSWSNILLNPSPLAFEERGKNRKCHSSYHELAYLHPNRFKPDLKVLEELGLKEKDTFFILRFNAFKAHHDVGIMGLNLTQKLEIVNYLKPLGKIFITTEREMESELKEFQMSVAPEKIHSLLYYATMFVGDSQTMTSEAALLGTPAVKLNSFAGKLSIPNEIENKYGLCYSFLPNEYESMVLKIKELLNTPNLKQIWQERKVEMLKDKIDFSSFITSLVSNYPQIL